MRDALLGGPHRWPLVAHAAGSLYHQAPERGGDRKKVYVFLTPKGRQLRHRLVPLAEEVNRIAVRGVRPADISTSRSVLFAIIENLARDEQAADMRMPSTRDLARLNAGRGERH